MRWIRGGLIAAPLFVTVAALPDDVLGASPDLTLPDVTVSAPPVAPAYRKWNPYGGNIRVEEDKWPDIPCSASRIAAGTATGCKTGPMQTNPGFGVPLADRSVNLGSCKLAHDLVMNNLGTLSFEADVMVLDPYFVDATGPPHKGCTVESGFRDPREDFPDMNQMTRNGGGWRNFVVDGDISRETFSLGRSDCVALEKRGPRWQAGHVYMVHASICRNDGRPVETADIERVLGTLLVRQYEPVGNLRAPPK